MAKLPYSNLKLKVNSDVSTLEFEDKVIEVKKYLPIQEKKELINLTITNSIEQGQLNCNEILVDTYFNFYLIKYYTNISFTDKQLENIPKIVDAFDSTGWMEKIIDLIPKTEYEYLRETLDIEIDNFFSSTNSAMGIAQHLSTLLSESTTAMTDKFKDLNLDNISNILTTANNMNGLDDATKQQLLRAAQAVTK